jgi:Holliday junction resolvase RusA-like endonuclease
MSDNEDTGLNNLNQYRKVDSENGRCFVKESYKKEEGKKWRQFLAAVICEFKLQHAIMMKIDMEIIQLCDDNVMNFIQRILVLWH